MQAWTVYGKGVFYSEDASELKAESFEPKAPEIPLSLSTSTVPPREQELIRTILDEVEQKINEQEDPLGDMWKK